MTCVACQGQDLSAFISTRQLKLYRCAACGSLTALPRPSDDLLAAYHDTAAYFDHPYFARRRADVERTDMRCRDVFRRLQQTAPALALAGLHHLDIGCDTGLFLERFAHLYGTQPHGIDLNARAVAEARARGIAAQHTDLSHATELPPLDLVTMIDVIEHVTDPVQLLRDVRARLRPGGLCFVETPNVASAIYVTGTWLSKVTGGRPRSICERLFLPEHVQYFSAAGLDRAARAAGFRTVGLTRRCLQSTDVNAGPVVGTGVAVLQIIDRALERQILHCAVLAV
jgi:SAM-dependent methyltransferase